MRMIVLFAAAVMATASARAEPVMPDWLQGAWLSCSFRGLAQETAEIWTGAGSNTLVGVGHTRQSNGVGFEYMRIAPGPDGVLTFFGSPQGAPATPFRLKTRDALSVTFENPAHDFPQRIVYARDGAHLTARIEGMTSGGVEVMEWRYRRARVGERCR
jgi:hypothetical protein